jgi:hypothetical protein
MRKLTCALFVGVLAFAFALPAIAADVSFYGDARMVTMWHKDSKETANLPASAGLSTTQTDLGAPRFARGGFDDDTDIEFGLDRTTSRFGLRASEGPISFNVELRPEPAGGVRIRHWYGAWNFGPGSLIVGQTWLPDSYGPLTSCCQGGGNGPFFGDLGGSGRAPQIALWMPIEGLGGMLRVALSNPVGSAAGVLGAAPAGFVKDMDATLPKVVASLSMTFGPAKLFVAGGYNWTEEVFTDLTTGAETSYDVNSWYTGLSGSVRFGPFDLGGAFWLAQNANEYGWAGVTSGPYVGYGLQPILVGTSVEDADFMGYGLRGQFHLSPMIFFEAGYFALNTERKAAVGTTDDENDQAFLYLRASIQLIKNMWIEPEIGKYDFKDRIISGVSIDEGDTVYGGLYWRIAF